MACLECTGDRMQQCTDTKYTSHIHPSLCPSQLTGCKKSNDAEAAVIHKTTQHRLDNFMYKQFVLCPVTRVGYLVGALSPVNQKELYTSGLRTRLNPPPSHSFHKSLYQKSLFSNHRQNYVHNFGTQTHKNKNTCFVAYLYSMGTQHRNLHQLSVTMSRVTYFILQAHTGAGVSHSQHSKNSGVLGKNAGEWP